MFAYLFRGRNAPPYFLVLSDDRPIRPDEARFAACALALGETRPARQPRYRPPRIRRGTLPDVDYGNAVPAPSRPSLLRRVLLALRSRRPGGRAAAAPELTGELPCEGETGYGRAAFSVRDVADEYHRRAA